MKFLFVTDYLDSVGGGFEPLGMLYVMGAARAAGHQVDVVPDDFEEASRMVSEWRPDFVGYCAYTGFHKPLIDFNLRLKRDCPDFISVFGGPHPTFFPEMVKYEGVDAVCRGEGEEAVAELLDAAAKGEDYTRTRNFWFKRNGEIIRNEVRPLERNLEKFAFPARDIFYKFEVARKSKVRCLVTARGCPYSCTYCYNYKYKELYKNHGGKRVRHRDPDHIIDEVLGIKERYPLQFFYIGTDCFTADKDWVIDFCDKYRRRAGVPFLCSTRPETTNPEVCRALKAAGCITLAMGLETGNEKMRRELLNRRMSNEQIVKAAEYIHEAGIKLYTFNMLGLPGETVDMAFETVKLNQQCKTDYAVTTIFMPYPQTKMTDYAIEAGFFDGDFDHMQMYWHRTSSLDNPQKDELDRLHKLLPFAVEFPWGAPLIRQMIKLPLGRFYHFLSKLWKAYCYRFRVMPVKLNFREVVSLSVSYLFGKNSE